MKFVAKLKHAKRYRTGIPPEYSRDTPKTCQGQTMFASNHLHPSSLYVLGVVILTPHARIHAAKPAKSLFY